MLIYSPKKADVAERLLRVIGSLFPGRDFEIHRSIDELMQRLQHPVFNPTIVILLASTREELQDILSLRDLSDSAKIILILPDSDPETLAKGHTLRPRFMSDCNSDFVDVAAVLGLMMKTLENCNNDVVYH